METRINPDLSVDSPIAAAAADPVRDALYHKAMLRFMPLLCLCLVAAYLDRVNVGFAKLTMLDDLGFSNTVYGFGAGIFFLGYFLFEVPSNVLLHKIGARVWIARIMITWGLIGAAMAFVQTSTQFYVLRFLLGVAEAGFIPGVMYFLSCWFPSARRGRVLALLLAAVPLSSVLGGPLSGWILASFSGVGGWHGWQWLFMMETIPSIVLGVAVLKKLADKPSDARWLSAEESALIAADIAREAERNHEHADFASAFKSKLVWQLSIAYFCIVSAVYVLIFWLPTLIKQHGISDPVQIGWLTAIPYFAAIVASIWNNARADRLRERRWHTAVPCFVTAIGLALSWLHFDSLALTMLVLTVAAAAASTTQAAFWSVPPTFLSGAAAAAGLALINSVGNVGGMVSTSVVGWITDVTGNAQNSLILFAAVLLISVVLILKLPARLVNH
jgi:sugar phosphate permease